MLLLWIGDDGQLLDVLEKPKDSDQTLKWIQSKKKKQKIKYLFKAFSSEWQQ